MTPRTPGMTLRLPRRGGSRPVRSWRVTSAGIASSVADAPLPQDLRRRPERGGKRCASAENQRRGVSSVRAYADADPGAFFTYPACRQVTVEASAERTDSRERGPSWSRAQSTGRRPNAALNPVGEAGLELGKSSCRRWVRIIVVDQLTVRCLSLAVSHATHPATCVAIMLVPRRETLMVGHVSQM